MANNSNNETNEDYLQGSQNRKVFTTVHNIAGLPAKVFFLGVALTLCTFFIGTWYFAVLIALIYFPPMYTIHKDDPRALDVWKTTLTDRTSGWEAGNVAPRVLVVLTDDK